MKTHLLFACTIFFLFIASCRKQSEDLKSISASDIARRSYTIDLTPEQAVALFIDQEDLENNCALYQLADAMHHNMSLEIMEYIFDQVSLSTDLDGKMISYDELFNHFPSLQSDIDNYLNGLSNNQPYDFNSYGAIRGALDKNGITYEPVILMPRVIWDNTSPSFVPSVTDYVWAVPVEVDEEDGSNQDDIFAWEYTAGDLSTVATGEAAATSTAQAKGVFLTTLGKASRFGYEPDPSEEPDPLGSDPWGPEGGQAVINRIKIYQRFESNKWSEVKLSKGSTNRLGTTGFWDHNLAIDVANVHKNNIGQDAWTNTFLTNYINWNEDKYVVYNLYEYDWYGNKFYLGGRFTNSHVPEQIGGDRKYLHEYYLFDPYYNTQNNGYTFSHPVCVALHNNGWLTQWGANGDCSW